MTKPRRPRAWLSEEELRLWIEVARTAKPLRGKALPPLGEPAAAEPVPDGKALPGKVPGPISGGGAARAPASLGTVAQPPLAVLERRLVQRLRRGKAAPGAMIDLHGLRQDEARRRLSAFLHRCQAEGAKTAIIVTGKGTQANALAGERGVLRRSVPLWLAMPDLRPLVIGFQEAGTGLGGTGALIVRVRARRQGR